MAEWQLVDGDAPERVQQIAGIWGVMGSVGNFYVFYGNNQELYCLGRLEADSPLLWLELPALG